MSSSLIVDAPPAARPSTALAPFDKKVRCNGRLRRMLRAQSADLSALHSFPESVPTIKAMASARRMRLIIGRDANTAFGPDQYDGIYAHHASSGRRWIMVHPTSGASSLLHEVGHWIDDQLLPGLLDDDSSLSAGASQKRREILEATGFAIEGNEDYASACSPALDDWFRAVAHSDHYTFLLGYSQHESVQYLLARHELFARSYEQWAMNRLGVPITNPTTEQAVRCVAENEARGGGELRMPVQWDDDDFASIAAELDQLFGSLGWI